MGIHIHIHHHFEDETLIIKKLNKIMANIHDLEAKADALQVALDLEQQQIADAIAALQETISELQTLVADGGTTEERQALADKLDAITVDLQSTIPDTTTTTTETTFA